MMKSTQPWLSRRRGRRRIMFTTIKPPLFPGPNSFYDSVDNYNSYHNSSWQTRLIHNSVCRVHITCDVLYSSKHSRNLMDIYEPSSPPLPLPLFQIPNGINQDMSTKR
mmetsp:Transcript_9556/g.14174  ORF Transcript_9556/g.14174 Transcript_9556/m.14174 type:complete len:108 (+) Transcript_9556:3712-4035(+)